MIQWYTLRRPGTVKITAIRLLGRGFRENSDTRQHKHQLAVFTNYLQFTRNIFDAAFEMLVYGEWDTVKIFPRWNSNDLYCYNVKYCLNNGACWPNYPSPGTKQASEHWKYLHLCYKNIWGYEKYLSCVTWRAAATWLPTLLPLDSCLACHSEPTMLSRLLLVWSAPTPTTPLRTPWKYFIPLKIFYLQKSLLNSASSLRGKDIDTAEQQWSVGAWQSFTAWANVSVLCPFCSGSDIQLGEYD